MPLTPANRARLHALLACIGTLILWWRFPGRLTLFLVVLSSMLALLACLLPRAFAPVQRTFDAVTHGLLTVLSWALLGLVYFGLFTPLRLWRGLTRRDPLQLHVSEPHESASFLQPSPPASSFERQF